MNTVIYLHTKSRGGAASAGGLKLGSTACRHIACQDAGEGGQQEGHGKTSGWKKNEN